MTGLPIVAGRDDDEWIIARDNSLTQGQFLRFVQVLAEKLPQCKHAILLCRNRRNFLIGFAAAMAREQTALLPPNQTTGAVLELAEEFPDSYCLVDEAGPSKLRSVGLDFLSDKFGSSNEIPASASASTPAIRMRAR